MMFFKEVGLSVMERPLIFLEDSWLGDTPLANVRVDDVLSNTPQNIRF
jgi:hypothetical protein